LERIEVVDELEASDREKSNVRSLSYIELKIEMDQRSHVRELVKQAIYCLLQAKEWWFLPVGHRVASPHSRGVRNATSSILGTLQRQQGHKRSEG